MAYIIKIFGKKYISFEENSVRYTKWLPDFFSTQKSFSPEEYYKEMVKNHPEFKKKWYERIPSEKEIQRYFIKEYKKDVIDGADSIPKAEKKFGIQIGGKYTYPGCITDIEYHAKRVKEMGLPIFFDKKHKITKEEAYMEAWQKLHYKEDVLQVLQKQYKEIVKLNPQLAKIRLNKNNPKDLQCLLNGVTYDFPVADIQSFIDGRVWHRVSEHVIKRLKSYGLKEKDFDWVPSTKTIHDIGQKVQAKRAKEEVEAKNKTIPQKLLEELKKQL